MIALAAVYASMSLLAFLLYAADKRRATRREWRISESASISSSSLTAKAADCSR